MNEHYGPTLPISEEIHSMKYRGKGESFRESMIRVADALKDSEEHYDHFKNILLNMRFLPAGRIQSAAGSPRAVTCFNCFVSKTIEDSMSAIMDAAKEAAETMRLGGGIGYDFSSLRPRGALIKSLDSRSSGPLAFMDIFDTLCKTIASAGHRRGAQMGVLRVDHPDIEEFIRAKNNSNRLTQFNISVGITDEFMDAVINNKMFDLRFEGQVYKQVSAVALWNEILRGTWDWAEPGILFLDRINRKNNLHYCETIASSNPCAEQPLPPYGACLLGSINLTKYIIPERVWNGFGWTSSGYMFDWEQLAWDIPTIVRAMDNVIDHSIYPLPQQKGEALSKRRMGLGLTGVANTGEILGYPYGSKRFLTWLEELMAFYRNKVYEASIELAKEKGSFPLFDVKLLDSEFAKTLPEYLREGIRSFGLRNSHLLSIAPTGK